MQEKKGSQDKFVSVNHAKTKAMNKVEKLTICETCFGSQGVILAYGGGPEFNDSKPVLISRAILRD